MKYKYMNIKNINTDYGKIIIDYKENIFHFLVSNIFHQLEIKSNISLLGGTTLNEFYKWVITHEINNNQNLKLKINSFNWFVSDERYVSLADQNSNFGQLNVNFLQLLNVNNKNKFPWPIIYSPINTAEYFNCFLKQRQKKYKYIFDVCFLGIGENDCHTASLFPQNPILKDPIPIDINNNKNKLVDAFFYKNKGWRLSITPFGLSLCKKIIILSFGKNKSETIKKIFFNQYNPYNMPVHIVKNFSSKVLWLLDEQSSAKLL